MGQGTEYIYIFLKIFNINKNKNNNNNSKYIKKNIIILRSEIEKKSKKKIDRGMSMQIGGKSPTKKEYKKISEGTLETINKESTPFIK